MDSFVIVLLFYSVAEFAHAFQSWKSCLLIQKELMDLKCHLITRNSSKIEKLKMLKSTEEKKIVKMTTNIEKYVRFSDSKIIFPPLIFQIFSFKNWNNYKGQRLSLHRTRPNQSHLCSLWSTRDSKTFRFFHERNPKLHI